MRLRLPFLSSRFKNWRLKKYGGAMTEIYGSHSITIEVWPNGDQKWRPEIYIRLWMNQQVPLQPCQLNPFRHQSRSRKLCSRTRKKVDWWRKARAIIFLHQAPIIDRPNTKLFATCPFKIILLVFWKPDALGRDPGCQIAAGFFSSRL